MWISEKIIWTVSWTEKPIVGNWPCHNKRTFFNQKDARGFAKLLAMKLTTLSITIVSTEEWRKEK